MEQIISGAIEIINGLLAMGIIVFLHELGHFMLAKKFGVRVETFSIGFGTPIIKFRKNETLYQVGVFLFGGFCKLAGEEPNPVLPPKEYEFYAKPPIKRFGIVIAGPLMNYISGIIFFTIVFFIGIPRTTFSGKILVLDKIPVAKDKFLVSPAKEAGLKDGDVIIEVNGKPVKYVKEIQKEIAISGDSKYIKLKVKRDNKILDLKVKPVILPDTGESVIGVIPYISNEIETVFSNTPAYKVGLKPGDKIISMNNNVVKNFRDIKLNTYKNAGKEIKLKVLRKGKVYDFKIIPYEEDGIGMLGVRFNNSEEFRYFDRESNLFSGIKRGIKEANRALFSAIYSLRLMLAKKIMVRKSVAGPVRIIAFTGKSAIEGGIVTFLLIVGLLSVTVAFFNLLPIPAVDGSFILIFLFEAITKKKVNYKLIKIVQNVGFVIIILLFALVTYNDIINLTRKEIIVNPFNNAMI